jgi:paraquat-inducible protein B
MGDVSQEVEDYLATLRKRKEVPVGMIPIVLLIIGAFLVWTFVLKK